MGYDVWYTLVEPILTDTAAMQQILDEPLTSSQERLGDIFDINGDSDDWQRWPSLPTDMCAISAKYPDRLFIIEGQGEDYSDQFRYYFKNGKSQWAEGRIEYDPFDENKLE